MLGPAIAALRFGYVAWAVVELAAGHLANGLALAAIFAVLFVPRVFRLSLAFEAAFLVAWTLQALGQVAGLWTQLPWWDTLVHFVMPAVLGPTALVLLIRYGLLPNVVREGPRRLLTPVLLVVLVAAGAGAMYEVYEWLSDANFATHYQPNNSDTMIDTVANTLGGVLGGLAFIVLARSSTGSGGAIRLALRRGRW
jgi:hypothetical protein